MTDEKRMQEQLEIALSRARIRFVREHRLSDRDVPDFFIYDSGIDSGIVVECKLRKARKMDIWKQLERYASHSSVTALVLASNASMGLPGECGGKPLYSAKLSLGWL